MLVLDSRGAPVPLGGELGRGGEGTVFAVANRPEVVAKVYHRAVDPEHAAKLAAMTGLKTDRLLRLAAWPVDILQDRLGGSVVGLLMPRVTGYQAIHNLYSPKARRSAFPNAGWPFLIHAATNVARAFAVIHEHGHVVGDVNHGNVVVSRQAMVMLIDCDSFQVAAAGRRFLCEVGVSTHQPPELQAIGSFRGVVRTPNHDNFGLAVLIFQTLLMGRHPFAGLFLGAGDMPIERAILEHRFAYGAGAVARQMRQPPNTLPLDAVSGPVARLFERAFAPDSARDGGRPSARDWIAGLDALAEQVKRCSQNRGHSYLETLPTCPWCAIEAKAGVRLFAQTVSDPPRTPRGIDLGAIWAAIEGVASPGPAPALPVWKPLVVQAVSVAREHERQRRVRQGVAVGVGALGGLGWAAGFPIAGGAAPLDFVAPAAAALAVLYRDSAIQQERQRRLDEARSRWRATEVRWKSEAGDGAFRAKRRELERVREEYLALPNRRQQLLRQLETDLHFRQLQRYLDQFPIGPAKLTGIGPGREATLRSYGIETAADVSAEALAAVSGFGPTLTGELIAWRQELTRSFVFDPSRGADPADLDALESDLRATKKRLEQTLQDGPAQLRQIALEILQKRLALRPEVERVRADLLKAEAELRV
jgi:DNA-binding helix-hairpin-helix protein with protein kinase domain